MLYRVTLPLTALYSCRHEVLFYSYGTSKIIVHVVFFYSMGWPKTLHNGPTSVYSYEALNISPAVGHYILFTLIDC